ncbi:MAG TPA: polymer-forming cytoskeletal protein [Candidatus Polarisedimenticolia bacterium]
MLFKKRIDDDVTVTQAVPTDRVRESFAPPGGGRTTIGAHTRIRGVIRGEGPVVIHGAVDGTIALRGGLTIGSSGRVTAEVEAQSVDLAGEARGSIRAAARVLVSATGLFEGEIATPVLQVQPGSIVSGRARVLGVPAPGRGRVSH